MAEDLPSHHFRIRDNGVGVFRVVQDSRERRLDLVEIATLTPRDGKVKPKPGRDLTGADHEAIADWLAKRRSLIATRDRDEILRTIDRLGLAAQWAQSRASQEELESVTGELLLAMHDLRSILIRKQAKRLEAAEKGAAE